MTYTIDTAIEPVSDAFGEGVANGSYNNWWAGCDITYSASNMTFNLSTGNVVVNGVLIVVAAQTNVAGLVADATNPRWAIIYVNNSGTAGVVVGTAAANPAVPALDYTTETALAFCIIQANQTVANSMVTKLDKRIPTTSIATQISTDFTATTNTTLASLVGAAFWLPASGRYAWWLDAFVHVESTSGLKIGATGPTGVAVRGMGELFESGASPTVDVDNLTTSPITFVPAGTAVVLRLHGVAVGDTTHAGIVQLQAAQNSSDAATVTISSYGSAFVVRRLT